VDKSTLGGISLAVAGIAVGLYLDGGKVGQLLQPTAALIVFGGTLGAVMVQFPFSVVKQAVGQLKAVFIGRKGSCRAADRRPDSLRRESPPQWSDVS
jgi:chemotaxis protein MotA